jgi:hypothetical protein
LKSVTKNTAVPRRFSKTNDLRIITELSIMNGLVHTNMPDKPFSPRGSARKNAANVEAMRTDSDFKLIFIPARHPD